MTNSHSEKPLKTENETWQPVRPPKRGEPHAAFYSYMLLPGLSLAFHAAALGRSRSSVAAYKLAAIDAARSNPEIAVAVEASIWAMRAEHGLQMARRRGSAQLPYWSRMAICEYLKRGFSRHEIAVAFRCSIGTVANVLGGKGQSYGVFSGERRLTHAQRHPPGRWVAGESQGHRTSAA